MSAGLQTSVEREASAGILRAVLNAAARKDTKSTMELCPFTHKQTMLTAKVGVKLEQLGCAFQHPPFGRQCFLMINIQAEHIYFNKEHILTMSVIVSGFPHVFYAKEEKNLDLITNIVYFK